MLEIYHQEIPSFIEEAAASKAMRRLQKVGMDCGCEYTSFSRWQSITPYKRYEHSIGVSLIIWHFTNDVKQSLAGLFHDISSPAFAHVVDFMNKDYLKQESTEEGIREILVNSPEIMALLEKHDLSVDDVCDYHKYPIADNDQPLLSADRLEYTLTNLVRYQGFTKKEVIEMYDDIMVGINEQGQQELMFVHSEHAEKFALGTLLNSRLYVCDEDRYAMELLARILRRHIKKGDLELKDLYENEEAVIEKIEKRKDWQRFRKMKTLMKSDKYGGYNWIRVQAKKRYIDPMVMKQGRISKLSKAVRNEMNDFLNITFDYYLKGGL